MKSTVHRNLLVSVLLVAILATVVLTGCGSSDDDAPRPPDYARKLAGAPPPLAALHKQENQLLPGGLDAYDSRIESLKGFPIVVNIWASWCGPCRGEFPIFQHVSARMGKKIAFLGVNSEDADELAKDFLAEYPVPYPSYTDPHRDIAGDLVSRGYPWTVFYDSNGKMTFTHSGPFTDQKSLEDAIQKYAIEGRTD